jgi:hypothetical protein
VNIFKFIFCLFVGHEWGDRGGSYDVCWRCGKVIKTEPRQTKDLQWRRKP